jgi:hypothetical protein
MGMRQLALMRGGRRQLLGMQAVRSETDNGTTSSSSRSCNHFLIEALW